MPDEITRSAFAGSVSGTGTAGDAQVGEKGSGFRAEKENGTIFRRLALLEDFQQFRQNMFRLNFRLRASGEIQLGKENLRLPFAEKDRRSILQIEPAVIQGQPVAARRFFRQKIRHIAALSAVPDVRIQESVPGAFGDTGG